MGEPLVGVAACFAAGIATCHFTGPGLLLAYAPAGAALLLWCWRDSTVTLWLFAFAAGFLLHFFQVGADRSAPHFDQAASRALAVVADGVIVSPPRERGSGLAFDLRLESLAPPGREPSPVHGNRVHVYLRGAAPALTYGDRLRIRGTLRVPEPARNPDEFDFAGFLRSRGIHFELTSTPGRVERLGRGAGNPLVALGLRGRAWAGEQLTAGLPPGDADTRAIILAMSLGAREDTPEVIEDKFRFSGTLHVFAVSGLHVGIVAAVTWFVASIAASLLRAPRRIAALVSIAAVLAYALVTGLRPSAVRAAIMATLFFGGMLFDREPQIFNSTGAAALVILGFDSGQLFRPGFQLSFCVLLCIAAFAMPIGAWLNRPFRRDPFFPKALLSPAARWRQGVAQGVTGMIGTSVAAWAGSTPLTWAYFGLVTPISIIANLALVPLAFLVIGTSALSVMLALVPHPLPAELANNANAVWAKTAAGTAGACSEIPGGHFAVPDPQHLLRAPCEINVTDLPYGGAAVHLAFRGGGDWLLDTGSARSFPRTVHPLLRSYGSGRLDGLLLSHPDTDHVGGAISAIDEYRPRRILAPPVESTSGAWRAALAAAGRSGLEVEPLSAGGRVALPRGAELAVLYPPAADPPGRVADDRCLVARLDLADGWRVLICGDIGYYAERWLVEHVAPGQLRCDLMLRGAHSSDESMLAGLIAVARPQVVVASRQSTRAAVQRDPAWAAAARAAGAAVLEQAEGGAVRACFYPDRVELRSHLDGQELRLNRAE